MTDPDVQAWLDDLHPDDARGLLSLLLDGQAHLHGEWSADPAPPRSADESET